MVGVPPRGEMFGARLTHEHGGSKVRAVSAVSGFALIITNRFRLGGGQGMFPSG